MPKADRVIVTGASPSYEPSLLALLGSLNCNWPGHPRVVVYDLGMSARTIDQLRQAGVEVRRVPAFCANWRSDFTWKLWCFRDAPAASYLWIDAGMCVLAPLDEAFECAEKLGYFAVALYNHPVAPSVPEPLRVNSGTSPERLQEMISISSGIHAICKRGPGAALLEEGYRLALSPDNMKATSPQHRHDQSLLTVLLYKHFGPPVLADYHVYAYHEPTGPGAESRQKVWVHRRKMTTADRDYFQHHLAVPGPRYRPVTRIPSARRPGWVARLRIAVAKLRGRYPGDDWVDLDRTILHGLKD